MPKQPLFSWTLRNSLGFFVAQWPTSYTSSCKEGQIRKLTNNNNMEKIKVGWYLMYVTKKNIFLNGWLLLMHVIKDKHKK